METDYKDYLYCAGLIGLVLAATTLAVMMVGGPLASLLGPYAAIPLFLLLALAYGGFTVIVLAVVFAWLPLQEGDYAIDHPQFRLWKVQHVVGELGKLTLSLFFPVFSRPAFYALFGARVGRQVAVAGKILDPRLTVLEDNCVLGEGSILTSHAMVQDRFILRAVHVGRRATVGVGCILMPGVQIGPGAVVLPGSVLKTDAKVPAGEIWGGVPAVRLKSAVESLG